VEFPETIEAGAVVLRRWRHEYAKEAAAAVQASLPELERFMPWAHEGYDAAAAGTFVDSADEGWAEERSGIMRSSTGLGLSSGRVDCTTESGRARWRSATGCIPTTLGAATRPWPQRLSPMRPWPSPGLIDS
jgi:hypothetical protein